MFPPLQTDTLSKRWSAHKTKKMMRNEKGEWAPFMKTSYSRDTDDTANVQSKKNHRLQVGRYCNVDMIFALLSLPSLDNYHLSSSFLDFSLPSQYYWKTIRRLAYVNEASRACRFG